MKTKQEKRQTAYNNCKDNIKMWENTLERYSWINMSVTDNRHIKAVEKIAYFKNQLNILEGKGCK